MIASPAPPAQSRRLHERGIWHGGAEAASRPDAKSMKHVDLMQDTASHVHARHTAQAVIQREAFSGPVTGCAQAPQLVGDGVPIPAQPPPLAWLCTLCCPMPQPESLIDSKTFKTPSMILHCSCAFPDRRAVACSTDSGSKLNSLHFQLVQCKRLSAYELKPYTSTALLTPAAATGSPNPRTARHVNQPHAASLRPSLQGRARTAA